MRAFELTIHTLESGELKCWALQILWTFSIYLEAVAILPQLVMLQRTQNIDNLTGNYVFLLGYATPACCPWLATCDCPVPALQPCGWAS